MQMTISATNAVMNTSNKTKCSVNFSAMLDPPKSYLLLCNRTLDTRQWCQQISVPQKFSNVSVRGHSSFHLSADFWGRISFPGWFCTKEFPFGPCSAGATGDRQPTILTMNLYSNVRISLKNKENIKVGRTAAQQIKHHCKCQPNAVIRPRKELSSVMPLFRSIQTH